MGGASESVVQAREAGLRSSSETSVFDFRESDSDGEVGSERQSLTDMRKDRDRRLQERHQLSTSSPGLQEVCDSELIDDSFWSGMCDQFVSQLEKGGNKVRKRGRRKKLADMEPEFETFETTEDALRAFYDIKPEEISPAVIKVEEASPAVDKVEEVSATTMAAVVENIKLEKVEVQCLEEMPKGEEIISEEKSLHTIQNIKQEEESSDEDAPLALRQFELKKAFVKLEFSSEKDCLVTKDSEKDKTCIEIDKTDKDYMKSEEKQKNIKKEITDSEGESSADENSESVAKRLRMRKPKEESAKETKRKTRSREKEACEKENSQERTTPQKGGRKKKEKEEKKKSFFGDGSEFRPGWEAEVYRYKRSLRMPTRLINIAGPQSWPSPKLSVSLPDLDPDSPMTLDSEISIQNKKMESDGESTPRKSKSPVSLKNKSLQKKGEEKVVKEGEEDSFLNRLIQRYGGKGKKSLRKGLEKDSSKERKGPKIIPQTNELQLLPTPSIDSIVKSSPVKKTDTSAQSKQKGKKSSRDDDKPTENEIRESIFLGYFRKKTVADFSNVFAKHNGGFATEHELPPIMLKSRTRTQTRILTQRATIREVFGEDRPASAPPAGCREDMEENVKLVDEKKCKKPGKKNKALLNKRSNSSTITSGTRSGLRSAAVLRSNKAVLKSKQQLLHGGERRKRSKDLIKAYKTSKKQQQDPKTNEETEMDTKIKCEFQEDPPKDEVPLLINEKRLKYRSVRRKLKSSGFDYIRKKKKQQQKKDGDSESVKDKKKSMTAKQNLESEEDIQNEIKGWVINKGLGETILHRAARLGYTDIAAYCLEKMDHNPSPRDNAGYTPLHEACSKGRLDIARLLLLYGADVSDSAQGGIRPLHEAAENGCLELIRLLLSYGADPQLATYSGLTPLSLTYNHPEARALLQYHLADVQGLPAPPWQIQLTDPTLLGNNPLEAPPSPEPAEPELEVEAAELSLPHLYQLLGEPHTDRWVLFQELCPVLRVKTREALIKQLGPNHRGDFRELKMTEFYDMARCCSVLGVGDFVLNPKAHKVTLVKYSERVRALLSSEKTTITVR